MTTSGKSPEAIERRLKRLEQIDAERLRDTTARERALPEGDHERHEDLDDRRDEEVNMALRSIAQTQLAAVIDAEHRLARGEYARCADCGSPIDDAHRRAMPSATRCLACQNLRESGAP